MTEPIDKATKIPPIPWAYTEDEKMEMFSIHTAGQDPVDCDNLFLVCGIWYQSSGREQGKAIADFIINSVNTAWAEKLKQERNKAIDECIQMFKDEFSLSGEDVESEDWALTKRMESLKDKSHE